MQLGPWGLVHHQKVCTLRIDYVKNGRLHTGLASSPWPGSREPGTHCMRMR